MLKSSPRLVARCEGISGRVWGLTLLILRGLTMWILRSLWGLTVCMMRLIELGIWGMSRILSIGWRLLILLPILSRIRCILSRNGLLLCWWLARVLTIRNLRCISTVLGRTSAGRGSLVSATILRNVWRL